MRHYNGFYCGISQWMVIRTYGDDAFMDSRRNLVWPRPESDNQSSFLKSNMVLQYYSCLPSIDSYFRDDISAQHSYHACGV